MHCSCAEVNSLYKRKCWTNSGGPLVNSLLWGLILFSFFLLNSTLWLFLSGKRQVSADFRFSNSVYLPYDTDLKVKLFFLPCRSLTMLISFFFALFSFSLTMSSYPFTFVFSYHFILILYRSSYSVFFICLLSDCTISLPLLKTVYYISKMKEREGGRGGESFSPELIKKFQ